jgi:perosamine synthetase
MSPKLMSSLKKVLYSGYVTQGPQVDKFEQQISKYLGTPFVATVNCGTSALHLALDFCDVNPGDEVISTPMTCTATNWPILAHHAKIVWADIDPDIGNIDPQSIKKSITKKTKAIMVVDWGGYPCDIDAIRKVAKGIPIIQDSAHAFGAEYKGKKVGTVADFTCFSFQAIKHLTTIDGGALCTRRKMFHRKAVLRRALGIDRKNRSKDYRLEKDIFDWGYKFNMNDVAAAIGIANFKHTKKILKKHRENGAYFRDQFKDLPKIELVEEDKGSISSYWIFTMKVEDPEHFSDYMKKHNVMASQVHRRNDNHPLTRPYKKHLPGVDEFAKHMVCIPVGWWVSRKEREYIAKLVKKY